MFLIALVLVLEQVMFIIMFKKNIFVSYEKFIYIIKFKYLSLKNI